jgi:hypothetical protein
MGEMRERMLRGELYIADDPENKPSSERAGARGRWTANRTASSTMTLLARQDFQRGLRSQSLVSVLRHEGL